MNDTITLKRVVTGEFGPQYWTVSGKSFDEMLAAVKALPFRQWQSSEKVWQVKMDGIKALRESGLTVTKEPDVRIELRNGHESIKDYGDHVEAEIVLNYRRPSGEWMLSAVATSRFSTFVCFTFSSEQIEQIAQEVLQDETVQKYISEGNRAKYGRETALKRLTKQAIQQLSQQAQERYQAVMGKRTADEYKQALQAAWNGVE